MRKIILILLSSVYLFGFWSAFADGVINFSDGDVKSFDTAMKDISANKIEWDNTLDKLKNGGKSVLQTFKVVTGSLAIVFMVWAGIQMVMSMGSNDKALAGAKRQMYYALTAFLFINVPAQLYEIFGTGKWQNVTTKADNFTSNFFGANNIFFNFSAWQTNVENGVVQFIKVLIFAVAILMFVIGWVQIIASGKDEKTRASARGKILAGVGGLIFLGLIQAWISVVYSGSINAGQSLFAKVANLALFFAGPLAIFFLIVGAFLFITSAGDEEKAKKGKNIIINTAIGTLILLAGYTFLKDLAGLVF